MYAASLLAKLAAQALPYDPHEARDLARISGLYAVGAGRYDVEVFAPDGRASTVNDIA